MVDETGWMYHFGQFAMAGLYSTRERRMTFKMAGGCNCGNVRYECAERPVVHLICHCMDCKKATGAGSAAAVFVPSDRLIFSAAKLAFHEVEAASGRHVQRGFCVNCGSLISSRWREQSKYQALMVGSLDDQSIFEPKVEVWISRAKAWEVLHPNTLKFDEGPSAEAVRRPIEEYFASRN
ncbi:MAG: GFA family protein [Hyphomicrobiales bacterium]|nr:GFA family protein [Hyphomicrobiales bacterium]